MSHSDDHPFHATRIGSPLGIRAIVAEAFWNGRIIHATYDIMSAHSGLLDRTPRAEAHPTWCIASAD